MSVTVEQSALLRLRRDLDISVMPDIGAGGASVVVADPVRGRYFKLHWPESGLLLAWRNGGVAAELPVRARRLFGLDANTATIDGVVSFARTNHLVEAGDGATWRELATQAAARRTGLLSRLLHNYLFFRLPLVQPDRALRRWVPLLSFVFTAQFWLAVFCLAALGLYLAGRNIKELSAAVDASLTVQALPVFGIAVLALKVVHEVGHALAAARVGCRVPSMGIAVMLGAPLCYTDVSDTWRLARSQDRLVVVFAGVAAEAVVATLCLLAWLLLDDGALRQLCFALATTAIGLSLLVNLNPLMRYDGYFALSDWWEIPNLQSRAFDIVCWHLRETLFALAEPPPESLPAPLIRKLLVYGWAAAIYRVFLFLGIALLLFYVAGKAIGIVLASIEIGIFIVMPVMREVLEWWKLRNRIVATRRSRITALWCGLFVAAIFVPWIGSVTAPAVLVAADEAPLHLPQGAQLTEVAVRERQFVRAGDVLFRARAPELERDRARNLLELDTLEQQAARWHAHERDRDLRVVIESRLTAAREKLAGVERRMAQLIVTAPFDGWIVDLDVVARAGNWFAVGAPLARIVGGAGVRARAVIGESDLARLRIGGAGVFISEDPGHRSVSLQVVDIRPASDGRLSEPALSERHGGSIPTGGQRGDQLTRNAGFEVTLMGANAGPDQLLRGAVHVEAERISPARLLARSVARIVVREQGF